jgi:mono/diheme cytochrome c family protein
VPAAQASEGEQVFKTACVACHGEDGKGGQGGGAPLEKVTDVAMVVAMVTDGRGNMPPLGEALTAEQIRAVAAYIVNDLSKQ